MSVESDPNALYRRVVETRCQDKEAVDTLARWFLRLRDVVLARQSLGRRGDRRD